MHFPANLTQETIFFWLYPCVTVVGPDCTVELCKICVRQAGFERLLCYFLHMPNKYVPPPPRREPYLCHLWDGDNDIHLAEFRNILYTCYVLDLPGVWGYKDPMKLLLSARKWNLPTCVNEHEVIHSAQHTEGWLWLTVFPMSEIFPYFKQTRISEYDACHPLLSKLGTWIFSLSTGFRMKPEREEDTGKECLTSLQ